MRILAVCTANIARSIMFEHIFSKLNGVEVKSCGLYPAKRFNEKATAFYDLKGIIPTKPAPESYSVYQHTDPFDVVVYLSNKANEIPRYGFGDPLQIQSEFPDPLSGAIEFRELYNTYKDIADNINERDVKDRFAFMSKYLNWVRILQNG